MPKVAPLPPPTLEQQLCEKWNDMQIAALDRLREGEDYVRQNPLQSVAAAAAAGYVLRILPVGAIVRSLACLALSAVKPAALLYGAAKAYDMMVRSSKR